MLRENRVRVRDYGRIISPNDPRLISIPSTPGKDCKLHHLAAAAFTMMAYQCLISTGVRLVAASGWRRHRWRNRADYEAFCVKNYGSLAEGQRWVAYDSPHETGLAVDLGCGGLSPDSKTAQTQKLTTLYHWLTDHAHTFGFTPYLPEPWHWEFHITPEQWRS